MKNVRFAPQNNHFAQRQQLKQIQQGTTMKYTVQHLQEVSKLKGAFTQASRKRKDKASSSTLQVRMEERKAKKRKMDMEYARKRRQREKQEEVQLQKQCVEMTMANMKLEEVNATLEKMLEDAKSKVALVEYGMSIARKPTVPSSKPSHITQDIKLNVEIGPAYIGPLKACQGCIHPSVKGKKDSEKQQVVATPPSIMQLFNEKQDCQVGYLKPFLSHSSESDITSSVPSSVQEASVLYATLQKLQEVQRQFVVANNSQKKQQWRLPIEQLLSDIHNTNELRNQHEVDLQSSQQCRSAMHNPNGLRNQHEVGLQSNQHCSTSLSALQQIVQLQGQHSSESVPSIDQDQRSNTALIDFLLGGQSLSSRGLSNRNHDKNKQQMSINSLLHGHGQHQHTTVNTATRVSPQPLQQFSNLVQTPQGQTPTLDTSCHQPELKAILHMLRSGGAPMRNTTHAGQSPQSDGYLR